jgi:uncharacterized repeat protein (TIGR01451 family)
MKKYFLLLFIFCLQLAPSKAQWVTIPDANFASKLTQLFPTCMNGNQMDTTCSQIVNAIGLDVNNSFISDLTGISHFSNLTSLLCGYNQLTSLPTLPITLTNLQCYHNQLSSLPNLPPNLIYLGADYNQLNNLPQLPNTLQYLYCNDNQLTSLPVLPNSLIALKCQNNLLTNLPDLPLNLEDLICSNNQLNFLPSLPINLDELDCSFNYLTYLPQVPEYITFLIINDNNISCLYNVPDALFVGITNNPITCIPNDCFTFPLGLPLCIDDDPINNPNNCMSDFNISGNVYNDQNSNCLYDLSDLGTSNISLKLFNSANTLIAQNYSVNGTYGFSVYQPGTYNVKIQNNSLAYSLSCAQPDSQNVNLFSVTNGISNINFPIQCNQTYDIYPQSVTTQGWVFPGQIHTLKANISSNEAWYNLDCGSSNYSGIVSISISGPVNYVAPANNALTPIVNGNTFTYNITDFNNLTTQSFGLKFLTDTTAQANDQICVHVEINPTPLDADTTNNVYDFCYNVVNSYDPNMKEVYPVNVLPGYDDWFTYTIHFQNTGNAPAFNIRLRDTLDANLDINTFEIRGYSHPAIVSINGNNLTVRFNNIMLPDSTTDYEGSMGYFQYRIKPLPNLPLGSQIENTAYIYFDYNAPIITNTTQNNFQTVVSTFNAKDDTNQLKVFPNPANEILNINLQNNNIENCTITNALGQMVYSSANEINANHKIQLNISNLNAGVYFVKVSAGNGSYNAKFIKSE